MGFMFQSPGGDSLFSDYYFHNGLHPAGWFQSPGGDSLFSDFAIVKEKDCDLLGFNPLAGIRCFLTSSLWATQPGVITVSIPWRGFVVF